MKRTILVFFLFIFTTATYAQQFRVSGKIVDESSGEGLVGANVFIEELFIGAATNLEGFFEILNVPDNFPVKLKIKYIGYEDQTLVLNNIPEEPLQIALKSMAIQGEEVVITAMARGQLGAINQQINALQIKNVVSAARIEELPDATAAEAIGRLPGISINRSGGEANKVSIRGLGPKYNNVTVEGVSLLSTNANDRSTDISMIAPNALAGIDVTKAVSADMMANSLGGTVNMSLKEASEGLHMDFSAQGGYTSNINAVNDFKFSGAIGNRLLNNKLGIFIGAYAENRYRGKDILDANWSEDASISEGYRDTALLLDQVVYQDIDEQRSRIGGSMVIDYRLPFGKIKLVNFGSRMNRDIIRHQRTLNGENSNGMSYNIYQSGNNYQSQMVNKLGGEFNILHGKINVNLAHAIAKVDNPEALQVGAWGTYLMGLNKDSLFSASHFEYKELINYLHPFGSDDNFGMIDDAAAEPVFISEYGTDREYTGSVDYELPFRIGKKISGFIKTGYMFKQKERFYDNERKKIFVANGQYNLDVAIRENWPDIYSLIPSSTGSLDIRQSWDDHFDLNNYFDGQYNLYKFMALDHLEEYANYTWNFYEQGGYVVPREVASFENDQDGTETYHNAYLMAELNAWNGRIRLIPGIRYEKVDYQYTALQVERPRGALIDLTSYIDTINSPLISHNNFFPSLHLIFKPVNWMDLRLAYSETISRPNFTAIIPRLVYNKNDDPVTVVTGNTELDPELAKNFDVYASFYKNKFGLFTIGAYYKQINDLILQNTYRLIDSAQAERVGADYKYIGTNYTVSRNNDWNACLYGLELDFQTNFRYLPKPFNGLVLNANFTYNHSETSYYGYILKDTVKMDPVTGRFRPAKIVKDTSYNGPILGMKDYIFNISLGYEAGGFSAHVSYLYQSPSQNNRDAKNYLSIFSDSYNRLDLKVKYKLKNPKGMELFLNLNNLTQTGDVTYRNTSVRNGDYTEREEYYGLNIHAGIRYRF